MGVALGAVQSGLIPPSCDRFNSLQEALIDGHLVAGLADVAGFVHLTSDIDCC